jgi:hypothetical protein
VFFVKPAFEHELKSGDFASHLQALGEDPVLKAAQELVQRVTPSVGRREEAPFDEGATHRRRGACRDGRKKPGAPLATAGRSPSLGSIAYSMPTNRGMLSAMASPDGDVLERETEVILERALRLSDAQRARLAAELFESLQGPAETMTDDWLAAVETRAERVRRGESQGVPRDEARRGVLSRLGRR